MVDVLVPTCDRPAELAATLAGLAAQDDPHFQVIVSDQSRAAPDGSDRSSTGHPAVRAMLRVLRAQGRPARALAHLPRRGMAEQRQFLLDQSSAPYVLFLDDDVWMEPGTLRRMVDAVTSLGCGLLAAMPQGLSFLEDVRPADERSFELWDGPVVPERLRPGSPEIRRLSVHGAANLAHIGARLRIPRGGWRSYKIAWAGACALYRRDALVAAGGFDFWHDLPPDHAGEDVAAQWRVMERAGGAGIVPSGTVHLESPTTLPHRQTQAYDVVFAPLAITAHDTTEHERITTMSDVPNPIQLQKLLAGVDYPASKEDLLAAARRNGADERVLDALTALDADRFDGPTAVSKAVSRES